MSRILVSVSSLCLESSLVLDNLVWVLVHVSKVCCRLTPLIPTLRLLFATYLPYRVSGSTVSAVGRSQLLARWPGTHSRILFGIQRTAQTVLGVYLKRRPYLFARHYTVSQKKTRHQTLAHNFIKY